MGGAAKVMQAHPGAAGVDHAGGAGDAAAAAPGGKQRAHQDDEGDAVSAGDHVVGGLDLFVGHDQPEDHERQQICTDRDDICHSVLSPFTL